MSTQSLLGSAIAGDEGALTSLLEYYGPQVRRELAIAPKWRSLLDHDDVMQVSYLEAYLRIRKFRGDDPGKFLAWFRQIARNNLLDAIKGLEREKRLPPEKRIPDPASDKSYLALIDVIGATTTTPSRIAAKGEIQKSVENALSKLPADYATVIRLFDLEGRSGPEVGAALKRSRGAAFMLLARARDCLREVLGSECQYFTHGD